MTTGQLMYAIDQPASGAPFLASFDGVNFNSSPNLTDIGDLPSGTIALASDDFAPEPAGLALLVLGIAGIVGYRRFAGKRAARIA
jgi:hypothetical protein